MGGHGRVELVTGSSGNPLRIARRFAPRGNRVVVPEAEQIDLLVSTDVLSEGVNLQDADTLINYDLHWNPVRLIQRAGRIDRIGSPNDEIHIASFLPERGLEAKLGLEGVLRARIREFLEVFGEDSQVLPGEEQLDPSAMVDSFSGRALDRTDESDEMDGLSRHAERILSLRRADPARYNRILTLRPGRRALSAAALPGAVATRIGWYWAFWQGGDHPPVQLDDLDGLERFRQHGLSGPATEAAQQTGATQELGGLIEEARRSFTPLARLVREQRTHPSLSPVEDWVRAALEEYRSGCLWSRRPLLDSMLKWVLTGQQKGLLRRMAQVWRREELMPEAVFQEMRALLRRYPLLPEDMGEEEIVAGVGGRVSGEIVNRGKRTT